MPTPITPATPHRPATVNVPATAPVFEKNPELEEDVLEEAAEAVTPVGGLVTGPVCPTVTDVCAVDVAPPIAAGADVEDAAEDECCEEED